MFLTISKSKRIFKYSHFYIHSPVSQPVGRSPSIKSYELDYLKELFKRFVSYDSTIYFKSKVIRIFHIIKSI